MNIVSSMDLDFNYLRGGKSFSRWILDNWGTWAGLCGDLNMPAPHLRKAACATSRAEDTDGDRCLPEHAFSTFAMIVVLAAQAHRLASYNNKVKALAMLERFVNFCIAESDEVTFFLGYGQNGNFVAPVSLEPPEHCVEVVSDGRFLNLQDHFEQAPQELLRNVRNVIGAPAARGERAVHVAELAVAASKARCRPLLASLVAILGHRLEDCVMASWGDLPSSSLRVDALPGASSSGKRADVDMLFEVATSRPKKRNRCHPERVVEAGRAAVAAIVPSTSQSQSALGLPRRCAGLGRQQPWRHLVVGRSRPGGRKRPDGLRRI